MDSFHVESFSLIFLAFTKLREKCPDTEIFLVRIQETADLVTFTEEILNGKFHFLCSALQFHGS